MLTRIEVDGQWYHATEVLLQPELEDASPVSIEPILDELGNMIPIQCCLCFAHTPSECCCDTDSWQNYRYDDDDY